MDQKRGQRLADECMSPEQTVVAEAMKKTPPPSLLDAKQPPSNCLQRAVKALPLV